MENVKRLIPSWIFVGLLILVVCFLTSPIATLAQTAGDKAVYNSSSTCCTYSSASIDASVLSGSDVCQQIYTALKALPSAGGVVDARGINSNMTCRSGETPWLKSGVYLNQPSTILLPAGTITMSSTWIMPNGTRLIGEQLATGGLATTLVVRPPNKTRRQSIGSPSIMNASRRS